MGEVAPVAGPTGRRLRREDVLAAVIVLDRFGHTSHNALVLGQTGTGKTMLTGAEMGRCFLRGVRILGVDPLGDYRRLVAQLGGSYLDLGAPGVGLNPFVLGAADPGAFAARPASDAAPVSANGLSPAPAPSSRYVPPSSAARRR